jgi:hypothetical protein
MTPDVRRQPRRGTTSACATKRMQPSQAREIVRMRRVTRPSLGPSTRARRSSLAPWSNPRLWGSRGGITAGQTHASGTNQHWGHHEWTERGSPRVRGLARDRAWHERKGWRSRPPSLRGSQEPGFGCPHVESQLQKSVGDVWPRISSVNALQKERQGRVNRGLAPRAPRWVTPSLGTWSETTHPESASPLETVEDRHKAQGGERSSSSGLSIAAKR